MSDTFVSANDAEYPWGGPKYEDEVFDRAILFPPPYNKGSLNGGFCYIVERGDENIRLSQQESAVWAIQRKGPIFKWELQSSLFQKIPSETEGIFSSSIEKNDN